MLRSLFASGLLCLSLCQPSQAQAPGALVDRLRHAAEVTTLDSLGSAPFHLKLAVQILPQYGRAADKGTVEIWWNAANQHRIVYELSQYHAVVAYTPIGIVRTAGAEGSPHIVDHLLAQVLHPMPDKINIADFNMEDVRQQFGKTSLDCIVLTPSAAKPSDTNRTTYCFDDHTQLRVILANPDQYNLRQTLGTLGTRSVPMNLQYTFLHNLVALAHIDLLETRKVAYPEASETADLVPVPAPPAFVPGQTLSGRLLHRPDPIYPDEAKRKHISGTVLLHGIIGIDGKVKQLSLIGSPDDSLTVSAMKAVSRWIYQPYILNGEPTEVDTTITVNYTFGTP